jgi:hypothetical protein
MNGCDQDADVLDDESRLPMCWDCNDEITALRGGSAVTLWDAAADGFRLGLFGGMFYGIGC